jgi:hypothetical protein
VLDRLRRWLMADGPSGSPHALSASERALLTSLGSHRYHNITAIAIQFQVRAMLRFAGGTHRSGLPDWLERTRTPQTLCVAQKRPIGGDYGLPWTGREKSFSFGIQVGGVDAGVFLLTVNGTITRFEIRSPSLDGLEAADPADVRLQPGEWPNEVEYWTNRALPDHRLRPINEAILQTVRTTRFGPNVVIPGPPLVGRAVFDAVAAPATYQRLLAYADGLEINGTSIWSAATGKTRVLGRGSGRLLYIGDSEAGTFAAEVTAEGLASDRIRLFAHPDARPGQEFRDVVELCVSLLRPSPNS